MTQLWKTLRKQPISFFLQLWETLEGWLLSRRWKVIALAMVPLLLLATLAIPVFRGYLADKQVLTAWYATIFSDQVESEANSKEGLTITEAANSGMDLAEISSRRLLQLQPDNEKARFYVAQGMERRGRLPHARVMMGELAPEDRNGYAPAHAWLVRDMLKTSEQKQIPLPQKSLRHHLQSACQSVDVDPKLLILYSALLENDGNVDGAVSQMQRAATSESNYWLELAKLTRRYGKNDLSAMAARNAQDYYLNQLGKTKDDTPYEQIENLRVQIALSQALLGDHDKAIETLMAGLRTDKPCNILRQALSNAHLARYQVQLERLGSPAKVGLEDIERSMFWNPANTQLADLISQLMAYQQDQREPISALLKQQVSRGEGVALTHILLANESIIEGQIEAAIPHLEIAYRHYPDALNVLNNLSLALATAKTPDLARAEELIDKAVKLGGEAPELMDTRGQVLALAGKDLDAIRSYEKAVALSPNRIKTRERLIAIYPRVGLDEMIAPQVEAIERIKLEIRQAEERRLAALERERLAKEALKRPKLPSYCIAPEIDTVGPPEPAR